MRSTVCHDVSSSVDGVAEESLSKIHLIPVIDVLTTEYGALLFSPKGCDIDGIPLGGGTRTCSTSSTAESTRVSEKNNRNIKVKNPCGRCMSTESLNGFFLFLFLVNLCKECTR